MKEMKNIFRDNNRLGPGTKFPFLYSNSFIDRSTLGDLRGLRCIFIAPLIRLTEKVGERLRRIAKIFHRSDHTGRNIFGLHSAKGGDSTLLITIIFYRRDAEYAEKNMEKTL